MTAVNKKKYTGSIFAVNQGRGFGFIISKDPDLKFEKVFFHWTALKNHTAKFTELKRGDEVEFETITLPEKGIRAINIDVFEKDETNGQRGVAGNLESGKTD